jgi:hypothetical protein
MPENWIIDEGESLYTKFSSSGLSFTNPIYDTQTLLFQTPSDLGQVIDEMGLFTATNLMKDVATDNAPRAVLEDVDITTYKIDGHETGTFMIGEDKYADKAFIVQDDKGIGHMIRYQDTLSRYYSPINQEIMDHLINSIKFTN